MTQVAFEAAPAEAGQRLDVVLAARLGESRSSAAARIERGEVLVGGVVAVKSHRVTAGDEVTVSPPPPEPTGAAGVPPPPVRYLDDHLLVVAKPAGMVVHPGTGNTAGTLVQALEAAGHRLAPAGDADRPGVVHRLDAGTSGLLVLARTDRAHARLVGAMKRRDVERRYLALTEGSPPADTGRIEVPIARDPSAPTRFTASADGREAVTWWQVLARSRVPPGHGAASGTGVGLLRMTLGTGRTHQIRVHLRYAGNPVVGDPDYGGDAAVADALGVHRPFLHAAWLRFDHPVTGAEISLHEPLPDDLRGALRVLDVDEPGAGR